MEPKNDETPEYNDYLEFKKEEEELGILEKDSLYSTFKEFNRSSEYKHYLKIKDDVLSRNIEFKLTYFDYFWLSCDYCGEDDYVIFSMINTDKEFTLENLECICKTCNKMKGKLSSMEFIDHCEKVVIYPDC